MNLKILFENYNENPGLNQQIVIDGWIKTCRKQKNILFIKMSDGTTIKNIQAVVENDSLKNIKQEDLTTGTSLQIKGILIKKSV